jgi:hypothetical protein
MIHKAERVILKGSDEQDHVPALHIKGLTHGRSLIVELLPQLLDREKALGGQSTVYFAGPMLNAIEVVDEVVVDKEVFEAAWQYAEAKDFLQSTALHNNLFELRHKKETV